MEPILPARRRNLAGTRRPQRSASATARTSRRIACLRRVLLASLTASPPGQRARERA